MSETCTDTLNFKCISSGINKYGATLIIDPEIIPVKLTDQPIVIDVETDESEPRQPAGIGVCGIYETQVLYFTDYKRKDLIKLLETSKLIGHNLKFDVRCLQQWGYKITTDQIYQDTMIMNYVFNTTAESHGLKPLAKSYLGMEWITYDTLLKQETNMFKEQKEEYIKYFASDMENPKWKGTPKQIKEYMNSKGFKVSSLDEVKELSETNPLARKLMFLRNTRCTLNYHPIEIVADYNAHDVWATRQLARMIYNWMNHNQRRIYNTLEMPVLRILFDMENQGVTIDIKELNRLIKEINSKIVEIKIKLSKYFGNDINLNSTKQIAPVLQKNGVQLPRTAKGNISAKKDVLLRFKGNEIIDMLLQHRKLEKMYNTFLLGLKKLPTLPKCHTTFNQVAYKEVEDVWDGINTNRLSSSNPNLQNIPKRDKEYADLIRALFIPEKNKTLIVGDYSQIEYRLLACFSKEPILLEAYQNDEDMHAKVGKLMGGDRNLGKSLNFAIVYGAGPDKVATMAGCSREDAEAFLARYWSALPGVINWRNRVIWEAKKRGGIYTLLRRFIPIPGLQSQHTGERMHAERQAVNYVIQGSAAEVIKLAMIKCWEKGFKPILQVHDELMFEWPDIPEEEVSLKDYSPQDAINCIQNIMENVIKISVSLKVDINMGRNWTEAKG